MPSAKRIVVAVCFMNAPGPRAHGNTSVGGSDCEFGRCCGSKSRGPRLGFETARPCLAPPAGNCFTHRVPLPYKISTLLYCFNEQNQVLLMQRAQEPNRGLWSPCGGKLHTDTGESPYACACREAREEINLSITPADLHLTGLVSEHGYAGQAHWLMFLFEVRRKLREVPPPHREGNFAFFKPPDVMNLPLPDTDKDQLWPLFWKHRGGFFASHCHCHPDGRYDWVLEESVPVNP